MGPLGGGSRGTVGASAFVVWRGPHHGYVDHDQARATAQPRPRGPVTVSTTAGAASFSKLGFAKGQIIQEFGYDDDVDDDLRFALEDVIGTELEDEDYNDGADGVVIWYRDGDEDLVDLMVDGLTKLFDQGFIVLL